MKTLPLPLLLLVLSTAFFFSPSTAQALSKKAATPAPAPVDTSTAEPDSIWVGKSDEAKSCAKEKGIGLDVMAAQLQAAYIKILGKKKISDGKMRIQMCGADKGDFNGFLISRKDTDKAKNIGFKPVPGIH